MHVIHSEDHLWRKIGKFHDYLISFVFHRKAQTLTVLNDQNLHFLKEPRLETEKKKGKSFWLMIYFYFINK